MAERVAPMKLSVLTGSGRAPTLAAWTVALVALGVLASVVPAAGEGRRLVAEAASVRDQIGAAAADLESRGAEVERLRAEAVALRERHAEVLASISEEQLVTERFERRAARLVNQIEERERIRASAATSATPAASSVQPIPPVRVCYWHLIEGKICETYP